MGLSPWGDLQEGEQRAQVDEGAEMKGDEKLHGGLGSCRALASQDGRHPTPTAHTENPPHPFHSHGNHSIPLLPPIPFSRQLQNSPTLYPIPMATAAPCSHSRVQGTPLVVPVPLWLQQEPTARGAKGGSSKVPGDPVQTSAHFPWCAGRTPRAIGTPGTHEDAEIHLGQGYTGPHV